MIRRKENLAPFPLTRDADAYVGIDPAHHAVQRAAASRDRTYEEGRASAGRQHEQRRESGRGPRRRRGVSVAPVAALVLSLAVCQGPAPGPATGESEKRAVPRVEDRAQPGAVETPARPPESSVAATEVETREVQLADDLITVRLHIPPGGREKKPAIISMMTDHKAFLKRDILVATYRVNWEFLKPPLPPPVDAADAVVGKWVLASPSKALLGQRYLETLTITANDVVPRIAAYLATLPEVDRDRIGVVGSSSNGFVALQAATHRPRLRAAVVLAACGDYHAFLRYSQMGMRGGPLELDPTYDRWLRAQEPFRHPARLPPTALLMVNRRGDQIIPVECADATARAVERAYRRAGLADRFEYRLIEGQEHGTGSTEYDAMMKWIDRWLLDRAAVADEPAR
jgi:dienelactone hydrolase